LAHLNLELKLNFSAYPTPPRTFQSHLSTSDPLSLCDDYATTNVFRLY